MIERKALITAVRQAAAESGVSPFVLRGWIAHGLLPRPPWMLDQLREIRDTNHPGTVTRGRLTDHGRIERRLQLHHVSTRA